MYLYLGVEVKSKFGRKNTSLQMCFEIHKAAIFSTVPEGQSIKDGHKLNKEYSQQLR